MSEAKIKLNDDQKRAVEQIDGPLLVLAGPGTGKTQLLSARIARILEKTDTLASSILCLTFTEKGASNMLERLTSFIGQSAYEVSISTYHAFGGDLIRSYPEYFTETRLENPIDDLGQHEIVSRILESLDYQNPLKTIRERDVISTLSEVKRALLSPSDLRIVASENASMLEKASPKISEIFSDLARMPGKLDKALPYFEKTLALIEKLVPAKAARQTYGSLAANSSTALRLAIEEASAENSTKKLTAWKDHWLAKNSSNQFILAGDLANKKLTALADILESYQSSLAASGLYDYDDMILRSIDAIEANDDFRFTLQEKYQYLLLDEYQDTSGAQAKLVELLTNNPVSEGRPNVMAVGDDDQAIYAFQGALSSNLAEFSDRYLDTKIISLTENYRSQPDILAAAANIASQIEDRASTQFKNVSKTLTAASEPLETSIIRQEFLSDVAERDWVASQIEQLIIKQKVSPSQIAVLAPRHKNLESLVPFLNKLQIPTRYEKRENILETTVVKQLIAMSRLVLALAKNDEALAASLWPEILSYDFWQIDIEKIWQISWADEKNWTKKLLASPDFNWIALFFTQLASTSKLESLETMLDYLTGAEQLKINDKKVTTATSPLKKCYTNSEFEASQPEVFYQTISHLTVLRQNLRDRQASEDQPLELHDLVVLADLYASANQRMINTSPYNQASESVQLMTVFKAKGLEFEHVFLLDTQDDVWGASASGGSNQLALPANLTAIRRAGASDDERLRGLFVALTRAKIGLYLASNLQTFSGKATKRLKYFDEIEQENGSFKSMVLPEKYQTVITSAREVPTLATLETNWQVRHSSGLAETDLKALLAVQIEKYQLSPTHLNTFIDLERGGPRAFLLNTLLKFPQAPGAAGQYGNAVHETLEWLQNEINRNRRTSLAQAQNHFEKLMRSYKLAAEETAKRIEQGKIELERYLASASFRPGDVAEEKFRSLAVFVGEAHLNGKIDKLELDKASKTLVIVDYKTGKPEPKWASGLKLHKYKQQLYIYKMLAEGSAKYRGWQVASERLDFIKPDANGETHSLELKFDQQEFNDTKSLVEIMWQKVQNLDFPDVSKYSKDFAGTRRFEADLIAGKI